MFRSIQQTFKTMPHRPQRCQGKNRACVPRTSLYTFFISHLDDVRRRHRRQHFSQHVQTYALDPAVRVDNKRRPLPCTAVGAVLPIPAHQRLY